MLRMVELLLGLWVALPLLAIAQAFLRMVHYASLDGRADFSGLPIRSKEAAPRRCGRLNTENPQKQGGLYSLRQRHPFPRHGVLCPKNCPRTLFESICTFLGHLCHRSRGPREDECRYPHSTRVTAWNQDGTDGSY